MSNRATEVRLFGDTHRDAQARRLTLADAYRDAQARLEDALTRHPSEAWVTVEITDAAKGEVRVETKVSAPLGCDLEELRIHGTMVRRIAESEHAENAARKAPADA